MCVRSIFVCILLAVNMMCQGQKTDPVIWEDTSRLDLTPYLTYFVDTSGTYTLNEIRSKNNEFRKLSLNENTYFYPAAVWAKITITSDREVNNKWLVLEGSEYKNEFKSYLDHADVYYVQKDQLLSHHKTGLRVPKKEKSIQKEASITAVPFSIHAGDTTKIYIRVKGANKNYQFRYSTFISDPAIYQIDTNIGMSRAFYSVQAMFLIIGIYVAIFYLFVRHISYLIFAGFCFLYTIHHLHIFPFSNLIDLFFPDNPAVAEPIHAFSEWGSTFFLLLFGYSFSNVKEILPKWSVYYRIILFVYLILCVWGVASFIQEPYPNGKGNFNVALILILPVSIRFVFSSSTLAKIFGIGILWFIFWRVAGITTYIRPFFAVGQLGLLMLYALGLGYQLKVSERERAQANQIKKIDAIKSRFFSNISHEFRTPLTLILSPINKILDNFHSVDSINDDDSFAIKARYLKMMNRNAKRLLQLVNQILDLSKIDQGKMQLSLSKGHLIAHIRTILSPFTYLAEKENISFIYNLPKEIPEALFDSDKIEMIISNLVSNAFKFTPANGEIKVDVLDEGDALTIIISDTGKGMDMTDVERIFERYYQLEANHDLGSGIGLALVKELVDLAHGKIDVQSTPGEGTTFTIYLPYTYSSLPIEGQTENEVLAMENIPEGKNIPGNHSFTEEMEESKPQLPVLLVIEDNLDIQSYIKDELKDGFEVKTADNGESGLQKAINFLPDLIISDIMMPEMNGLDVCRQLKSDIRTSHIPIILLTAKAGKESKIKGLEAGADDYLVKPFDSRELRLKVENAIERSRRLTEKFSNEFGIRRSKTPAKSMDEKFLQKVIAIIDKEIGNEFFSVENLAEEVGFSTSQLNRKLKALVNKSSNQLIRHLRLLRAKELIEQKTASISEIAFTVGFNNLSYFAKSYKESFGVLPSETNSKKQI